MQPHLMDNKHMNIPLQEKHGVGRKTPNLKLQCHRDSYLMEDFTRKGIKGEELSKLNIYWIWLKATCLSELATGDGNSISTTFWNGKPSLMKTNKNFHLNLYHNKEPGKTGKQIFKPPLISQDIYTSPTTNDWSLAFPHLPLQGGHTPYNRIGSFNSPIKSGHHNAH